MGIDTYLSEEYYINIIEDFIDNINIDKDELLEELLKEVAFEDFFVTNNNKISDILYIYKEGVISNVWKYGHKDVRDVGKDIKNIFSKMKGKANKRIEDYVLKKVLRHRKIKKIGASILVSMILAIAFQAYKMRTNDMCSKFKSLERINCKINMLDGRIKSIKDQAVRLIFLKIIEGL